VLHIDPIREPVRARKAFDSHLSRAKWIAEPIPPGSFHRMSGLRAGSRVSRLRPKPGSHRTRLEWTSPSDSDPKATLPSFQIKVVPP